MSLRNMTYGLNKVLSAKWQVLKTVISGLTRYPVTLYLFVATAPWLTAPALSPQHFVLIPHPTSGANNFCKSLALSFTSFPCAPSL